MVCSGFKSKNLYSKEDYNEVLSRLVELRERSEIIAKLLFDIDGDIDIGTSFEERGRKILDCGTAVSLGRDEENRVVITASNFCRQRLCPMCQTRRSLKVFSAISEVQERLTERGFEFLHMVLTVKNVSCEDLSSEIKNLFSASSRMFRDKTFVGWKGKLRCLEVSYSSRYGNFHPHLHVLIAVRKSYFTSRDYVSQKNIVEKWKEYAKLDYVPQVYISKADDGSLAEIAKYCVKPLSFELSLEEKIFVLYHLQNCLHGLRMLQSYGVIREALRDLRIDLNSDDDFVNSVDKIGDFVYNKNTRSYEVWN